jgi:hypothetical protein
MVHSLPLAGERNKHMKDAPIQWVPLAFAVGKAAEI